MPNIIPLAFGTPQLGKENWTAESATLIGRLTSGENCSFWFNSVVRADVCAITLGDRVNVQDGAMIHGTFEHSAVEIGDDVTIGHHAIVHGCKIEAGCLIGMGAIVLDNAVIGKGSVIAAGAVVLENTVVPPGSLYAGVPAKKRKDVSEEDQTNIVKSAAGYVKYSGWYK